MFRFISKARPLCRSTIPLTPTNLFLFSKKAKEDKLSKLNSSIRRNAQNKHKQLAEEIPKEAKQVLRVRKQVGNMHTPSQAVLQNQAILAEIRRQREQLEMYKPEDQPKQAHSSRPELSLRNFMIGLVGCNYALAGLFLLPVIPSHSFYLGVLGSTVIPASMLCIAATTLGVNLAYLVLRQGLALHTPTKDLQNFQITSAPRSYYAQSLFLFLQVLSVATFTAMPLLTNIAPQKVIYSAMFIFLLSIQYTHYQQTNITNPYFRFNTHSIAIVAIFGLAFVVNYYLGGLQGDKLEEFKAGGEWVKKVWKIKRVVVDPQAKITDLLVEGEEQGMK